MKIDAFTRLFYSGGQSANNTQKQATAASTGANQNGATDSVSFSTQFERVSNEEGGEARRKRVDELKRQVSNGTYRPSSEAVARSLAEELFA